MCDYHSNHYNAPHLGANHKEHEKEHKTWSRRSFLQALGIAGSGSMFLGNNLISASGPSGMLEAISQTETDHILVLIRLSGGNDGLSTIIPLPQFDALANARPNIYIPESKVLKLTDNYAIPSYMGALESLWGEGQFKAVHGVGYENQSLSHFTGSDIYSNTDLTTQGFSGLDTGWLGRHFEDIYPNFLLSPPTVPPAIQIGNLSNLIFQGEETNYAFVTNNVDQLQTIAESGTFYEMASAPFGDCMYGSQLKFLRGVANATFEYSGVIHQAYQRGSNQVTYQDNDFAAQLALLARLIKGNLGTKVYMISLGGFDTHGNQPEAHQELMTTLSIAIKNFYEDLAFTEQDDKVLSMTFSEFGRRIFENGSNGTDHGTAAPTLFFGSGLNGSAFVGTHPNIENPDSRGNMEFTMDFRDLYATVLAEWLCVPIDKVEQYLLGHPFKPINLGFSCSGTEFDDIVYDTTDPILPPTPPGEDTGEEVMPPVLGPKVIHKPFYPNQYAPHIYLEMPFSAHVDIALYNLLGQKLGTIFNEMVFAGTREINIREAFRDNLATGKYIYQINTSGQRLSKSIIVN